LKPTKPYIQSTRLNRTSVTYQCKSQLKLSGDGALHCDLTTGRWSQPSCSCQQPTLPASVNLSHKNSTTTNYECISPLVDKGSLTCDLLTGNWSPQALCFCPPYQCKSELNLTGSGQLSCDLIRSSKTGQWSQRNCSCQQLTPPPFAKFIRQDNVINL
jgi:Sushi repeat (SCR repeat)